VSAIRLAVGDHPDTDLIARAATVLLEDKVALLPAEGVYGFHARARAASAIERIRALKRDARAGFIGLIAAPGDLERWAHPSPAALELARQYWPGALTLVLDARAEAPESLRSDSGTIALRCPGRRFPDTGARSFRCRIGATPALRLAHRGRASERPASAGARARVRPATDAPSARDPRARRSSRCTRRGRRA